MIRRLVDVAYRNSRNIGTGVAGEIANRDLAIVVARRSLQAARGLARQPWLAECGAPLFMGAGVSLRHCRHLRIGRNVVLGDQALLDGLSVEGIRLQDHVTIGRYAQLKASGVVRNIGVGIEIGPRAAVGDFCLLLGQGGITIEADVLLAPYVAVVSENHNYSDPQIPIREQGETRARVLIEQDVWVGMGAVILAGVRVGRGSVVAAHSVVTTDVAPLSVVAGAPARPVGQRGGG